MYKATADAHARRTRTGSHSVTPDQRGHFDAMVTRAKPELIEICSMEEQEKLCSKNVAALQTQISELRKRTTGRQSKSFQEERQRIEKLHNDALARLHSIRSTRKRAANMAFCEVFREVAGIVLPQELIYKICAETNDVIMKAKRGANADLHL